MAARTIDGPGKGQFVTAGEAARWLHISLSTFKRVLPEHPWLRPVKVHKRTLYDWEDIHALARVLMGSREGGPPAAGPNKSENN